jgi:hypothetical protein
MKDFVPLEIKLHLKNNLEQRQMHRYAPLQNKETNTLARSCTPRREIEPIEHNPGHQVPAL